MVLAFYFYKSYRRFETEREEIKRDHRERERGEVCPFQMVGEGSNALVKDLRPKRVPYLQSSPPPHVNH